MGMEPFKQGLKRARFLLCDQRIPFRTLSSRPVTEYAYTAAELALADLRGHEDVSGPPAHDTISLDVPTYMVWGANTDVGKTLVSAGLAAAAAKDEVGVCNMHGHMHKEQTPFLIRPFLGMQARLLYLKPVQTGYPLDSDAALVVRQLAVVHACKC